MSDLGTRNNDGDTNRPNRTYRGGNDRNWIAVAIGALAVLAVAIILFFVLGGDADVDVEPGDVDVEVEPGAVDADVDAPDVDVEAPDVDVDPGSVDVDDADAEADAGS